MKKSWSFRNSLLTAAVLLPIAAPVVALSQNQGMVPTQVLVVPDAQHENAVPDATALTAQVNGKSTKLTSIAKLVPSGAQVALFIDDGISRSAGIQLSELQSFATALPAGTQVLIGYLEPTGVQVLVPFTADHAAAAAKIRLPTGSPGIVPSPYTVVSDVAKQWHGPTAKFILLLSNGIDPYTSGGANQDSPYVSSAIADAQRTGIQVSSIYYSSYNTSNGQAYLHRLADGTGGFEYFEGPVNPATLVPYFQQFARDLSATLVATLNVDANAGGKEHLVKFKLENTGAKIKMRYQQAISPGTQVSTAK